MLGKKLKGLFGSKPSASASPGAPISSAPKKLRRANIDRRFTILTQFSQGSMSRVYRALDKDAGRTICLKVQHKEKTDAAKARAVSANRPTEGEVASRINHSHVVRTFEYGETTKGDYYIVMEFIDGVSVQYLRDAGKLDYARKLSLLIQAAEGLGAVHRAGFIHHDFGPKNLLVIDRDNHLKLIDFGLAVPDTPEFHRPGNRTGTLQYMAPELIRREPTDRRIDVFSFGVTAFELFTGRLPYDATNSMAFMLQQINQPPMDPAKANSRLSPELCDFLRKATARHKEDRFKNMDDVLQALQALPEQEPARR